MKTLLLFSLLITIPLSGQVLKRQMLSMAGGSQLVQTGNGNFFIQESIGQRSVIRTFQNEDRELRQGFVQPVKAIVFGGDPNELQLLVYPNPFESGVVVNLNDAVSDAIDVYLFDMQGRLIHSRNYDENQNPLVIPLDNLSQGAYFLKVQSGQQQQVKQLLKR
ncbi:MAG: T9SS type A sorting domain-containing protein [Flavobacteriaceae bacterium]